MNKNENWFNGKVAIVTGSTKGIGKAIAAELGKRGAKVLINGRNRERLDAALSELTSYGYAVTSCNADATKYEDCVRMVKTAIDVFGKLDILIANAGIVGYSSFESFDPMIYKETLDSNIYATVFPSKAALPYLKESKGSLVFISSLAGMIGIPYYSANSAGKMSLTALSQAIREELKYADVHVGIVYVGFTKNEENKRFISADGTLVPVPPRKASLQQTREQVADSVLNLIRRRKDKAVLSLFGKFTAFVIKFFPSIAMSTLNKNK